MIQNVLSIIGALLPAYVLRTLLIISLPVDANNGAMMLINFIIVCVFAVNVYAIRKLFLETDWRRIRIASVGGFLFSLFFVAGAYLSCAEGTGFWISIMQIVFLSLLTIPITNLLIQAADYLLDRYVTPNPGADFLLSDGAYFAVNAGIVLLLTIPVFLSVWPGNYTADQVEQLSGYKGEVLNASQSPLYTLLVAAFANIGKASGDVAGGLAYLTFIQMIIVSVTIGYVVVFLRRRAVHYAFRIGFAAFFVFFPANLYMSVSASAYTMFGCFFAMFMVFFFRVMREETKWYEYVCFLISGAMACLLNSFFFWPALVGGLFIAILRYGLMEKIKTALLIIGVIALYISCDYVIATAGDMVYEKSSFWEKTGIILPESSREYLEQNLGNYYLLADYEGDSMVGEHEMSSNNDYSQLFGQEDLTDDLAYSFIDSYKMNRRAERLAKGPDKSGKLIVTIPEEKRVAVGRNLFPLYSDMMRFIAGDELTAFPGLGIMMLGAVWVILLIILLLVGLYRKAGAGRKVLIFPTLYLLVMSLSAAPSYEIIYAVAMTIPLYIGASVGDSAPGRWNRRLVMR